MPLQAGWEAHESNSGCQLLDVGILHIAPQLLKHDVSCLKDLHYACAGLDLSAVILASSTSGIQLQLKAQLTAVKQVTHRTAASVVGASISPCQLRLLDRCFHGTPLRA